MGRGLKAWSNDFKQCTQNLTFFSYIPVPLFLAKLGYFDRFGKITLRATPHRMAFGNEGDALISFYNWFHFGFFPFSAASSTQYFLRPVISSSIPGPVFISRPADWINFPVADVIRAKFAGRQIAHQLVTTGGPSGKRGSSSKLPPPLVRRENFDELLKSPATTFGR